MKKFFIGITLFTLLLSPLMANGEQETTSEEKKTTLTVWYHQYGEEGTHEAVERYADMYEEAHPDISVEVNWIAGDYSSKLTSALAAKLSDPDLFESSLTRTMIDADQVASLNDLFSEEVKNDFVPTALAENSYNGTIYGVKMLIDTAVIYYKQSVLDEAGISEPKTMSELLAAAEALTTADRKGLFLGNDLGASGNMAHMIRMAAGIDNMVIDGKVAFNTPEMREILEIYREIAQSEYLLYGAPEDWWAPSALLNDFCAIKFGGLWEFPEIKKELGADFGVMPLPPLSETKGNPAAFFGGWSTFINSHSKNIPEAKEYLDWMWLNSTGQEIQIDWNTSYGFHITPRKSATVAAEKLKNDPRTVKIVQYVSDYAQLTNPVTWDSIMEQAFSDMMTDVASTDKPIDLLVNKAAEKVQSRLDELNS